MRRLGFLTIVALLGLPVQGHAADKITFALNTFPYSLHYGVYAAKEEGFYSAAGLDVTIQRGYGASDTAKRVAAGAADIGMSDISSIALGRANGLPVREVAAILDRPIDNIFYGDWSGIKTPKDLEGRTLASTVGALTINLLPAFAALAGFDASKIKLVNVDGTSKYSSLFTKRVDAMAGSVVGLPTVQQAEKTGNYKIGEFVYSDYGLDYYSIGIIASDATIKNKPDLVRRVVAATLKGYEFARTNPDKAAVDFAKYYPEHDKSLDLAEWHVVEDYIFPTKSDAVFGAFDSAKMAKTIDLVDKYVGVPKPVGVDDVYAPGFVPAAGAGQATK